MFPAALFTKTLLPGPYFPPASATATVDEEPAALRVRVASERWVFPVPTERWRFEVSGAQMLVNVEKDPSAVTIQTISWADWLAERGNDTIATSTFTVPSGLTKVAQSHTTTTATVKLSGGTLLAYYDVVNEIVTAGGRTEQRTLRVYLVNR